MASAVRAVHPAEFLGNRSSVLSVKEIIFLINTCIPLGERSPTFHPVAERSISRRPSEEGIFALSFRLLFDRHEKTSSGFLSLHSLAP